MRVAAVTMVYNESVWAPVWARYYAGVFGAENCLVLDHGSDDGSLDAVEAMGVRVERLARSALDEDRRAALVSDCVAALLQRFDAVIHTDADELLVTDPARCGGLAELAGQAGAAMRAVGLDVQHLPDEEAALEPGRPIGAQRRWVRFSGAMCKPCLVREPVRWAPGFHDCDRAAAVGPAYLLHLRYADLGAGLARLRRTRGLDFARADANPHQRVPDEAFEGMMRSIAALPRAGVLSDQAVAAWMDRMAEGWARGQGQLGLAGDVLWEMPETVRAAF